MPVVGFYRFSQTLKAFIVRTSFLDSFSGSSV